MCVYVGRESCERQLVVDGGGHSTRYMSRTPILAQRLCGGSNSAGGRASSDFEFAVRRRGGDEAAQAMSRSAAEPKSRSALREISLVISFNGPSFLLSLLLLLLLRSRSSLFLFGLWGRWGRRVLIQTRNPPARDDDDDDGVADVSLILLLRGGRGRSVLFPHGCLNRV